MGESCSVCGASDAELIWQESGWDLVRCRTCDLVYVANPPDDEGVAALYTDDEGFHAGLTHGDEESAQIARCTAEEHLAEMAEAGGGPRPGADRLLDVGCAAGHFVAAANAAGWRARGVELNDATAAVARSRGLDAFTGTLGDLIEAEGDDVRGAFDAVTLWDVVEHVPDPVGLLRQAREVLAPGGTLWVATPNVDGLFPKASLRVAPKVGRWPHPEPPLHLSQFSERTIRNALARAGFPDVVVQHGRIPLSYTFGAPRTVLREPLRLAYTAVFAPMVAVGPILRRGDTLVLQARTD
jgi:2-polyprenyl-3-methyl-5-hydroxy-6-metoxy-1,4-benzoquinol methylase